MYRIILISGLLVLSVSVGNVAIFASGEKICGGVTLKGSTICGPIATAQKPAVLKVTSHLSDDSKAAALEVIARPVSGAEMPYLVGVFSGDANNPEAKLISSFSFLPQRIGEAQTFVLPTPANSDETLTVKLIPANPARDIKDAAVEIVGARLVKE